EGGHRGFGFASGMAAITAVMNLFSSGDHIIVTDDVYGGTYRFMTKILQKQQIEASFVPTNDLNRIQEAIRPELKAIFIETPTNSIYKSTDNEKVIKITK